MKKTIYFSFLSLAASILLSCQTEDKLNQEVGPMVNVTCAIQDFLGGMTTRTVYSQDESGVKIAWHESDRIAVFPSEGSAVDFTISKEDVGKEKATFTGGFFMPREGVSYYAIYPFVKTMLEDGQSLNQVTLDYEDVVISEWGGMDHLSQNDFMYAGPCVVNKQYELVFDFKHLNSLMLLKVKLPADASYSRFDLSDLDNQLIDRATIDLSAKTPVLTPIRRTSSITAKLGKDDKGLEGKMGQEVNIFMMLPPQDLYGKTLYLKLYTTDGTSYIASFNGMDLRQGSAYDYSKTTGVVDMTEVKPDYRWVFISDIHVGDKRSVDYGYSWHNKMRQPFINWLKYMNTNSSKWNDMIVVGDLVDEWICPADMKPLADDNGNKLTSHEFFGKIVNDNKELFDQFRELSKKHHLHYISGNHDMQVEMEDFEEYLPGVFEHHYDHKGLGSMMIDDIIWVEHGHRYDLYNAPFLDRNGSNGKSMIPPGYFVSRLVTKRKTGTQTRSTLSSFTAGFMLAINHYSETSDLYQDGGNYMVLCDGQDGMEGSYIWNAYGGDVYWTSLNNQTKDNTLYRDPSDDDEWKKRCVQNGTNIDVSQLSSVLGGNFYSYFDEFAIEAMNERNARICVFGHSHSPQLKEYNLATGFANHFVGNYKHSLYANSGGWVDEDIIAKDDFTASWVEIDRSEFEGTKTYTVKLFKFDIDKNEPILKKEMKLIFNKDGKEVCDDY